MVGHAVRAMYLYSGMADIATEYGDDSLRVALERLWDDLHSKSLYVTGGLGPSAAERRLHQRLRPAQRDRLCRDLRRGRPGVLGEPHARHGAERPLRRRDGAGALQWLDLRPVARRLPVLLRKSAGKPRRASSLELAPLPLLPAQYRADGRRDRQLHVRRRRRRRRRASLWRKRRCGSTSRAGRVRLDADEPLSLGRRCRASRLRPRRRRGSRFICAFPAGAGRQSLPSTARRSIWRRRHATAMPRSTRELDERRRGPARSRNAGRARACAPGRAPGRRPRRADARAAGLLPGRRRQSQRRCNRAAPAAGS